MIDLIMGGVRRGMTGSHRSEMSAAVRMATANACDSTVVRFAATTELNTSERDGSQRELVSRLSRVAFAGQ